MSIELTTKFSPQTDELFKAESKISLLTNTDFDWTGAHSIKLYKISTTPLNDYARNAVASGQQIHYYGANGSELEAYPDSAETLSRYGKLLDLSATTEELLLKHDRSFIFNVDKLDQDETQQQLEAGTALARELREVVVPEVDANVYAVMTAGAGNTTPLQHSPPKIFTPPSLPPPRHWTTPRFPRPSACWWSLRQPTPF